MNVEAFLTHPEIYHLIKKLKEAKLHEKIYSDIVDDEGHQYVDLVQGGGGVLGVAVMGYIHVLECVGIRFLGLAGTSVGAINSTLMASMGDISEPKAPALIEAFANQDLFEFVDGGIYAKELVRAVIQRSSGFNLAWRGMRALPTLMRTFGLNPGVGFHQWMTQKLADTGIQTTQDLIDRFSTLPSSLSIRSGIRKSLDGVKPELIIVASDVTTESKVAFPKMAGLYWDDPMSVPPSNYVRASTSIPGFFEPYHVSDIPKGPQAMARWSKMASYQGPIPEDIYFVDGGVMSNFPIAAFHRPRVVPRKPTFAIRLGVARNKYNKIGNVLDLGLSIFNAAKHVNDHDFILQNPDYQALVKQVDIGQHDWLNFSLEDEDKIDLFIRGAKAAAEFLTTFDWKQYKAMRGEEQKRWAYFKIFS